MDTITTFILCAIIGISLGRVIVGLVVMLVIRFLHFIQ